MDRVAPLILTAVLIVLVAMLCYVILGKEKKTLNRVFTAIILELVVWNAAVLAGTYTTYNIQLTVFVDNFAYFGAAFVPVTMLMLGLAYQTSFRHFSWYHALLYIPPVITMIVIFTNNFHHLFYASYTVEAGYVQGPYFYCYAIYSYACLFTGMVLLFLAAVRTSGILSLQAVLNLVGGVIPAITNICYTLHVPGFHVYSTPVAFTITVLLYLISMFRFGFLKVGPIAMRTVVDRISDCFVVVDKDFRLIDSNKAFRENFHSSSTAKQKTNLRELLASTTLSAAQVRLVCWNVSNAFETRSVQAFDLEVPGDATRYFNVECTPLVEANAYPAAVVLFKDVTQHIEDLRTLRDNQDILLERERLASLGQMIGGIAHNLKSPILAISGGIDQVQDLVAEYRESIDDPDVTASDHREIADDMDEWLMKEKNQLSYMSDIISTVKGQAAQLNEKNTHPFTVDEVIKKTKILMHHPLIAGGCTLDVVMNVNPEQVLFGDVNSLVQVLDNVIGNAIQSYDEDEAGNEITLTIDRMDDGVRFAVADQGSGIAPEVQKILFKEMTTTKGKHGTGLGLYMSYSTIKGMFRGNMWFETEEGRGTTFFLQVPLAGK